MAENKGTARPYAEAVFELANELGHLGAWSGTLHAAAAVVSTDEVMRLIDTPNTDIDAVVKMVADLSREVVADKSAEAVQVGNLLRLLAENGRLAVLPEIAELFDKLKADVENSIDVVLTAATPVSPVQLQKITDALKRRLGREINLNFQLDENLIGGARLQADDLVIDGSVRTGLEKLSSTLMN
jgi:F-type H+-transporting ATPase subunit delta